MEAKPRREASEDQVSDLDSHFSGLHNAERNLSGSKYREIWIKWQYFLKHKWAWTISDWGQMHKNT